MRDNEPRKSGLSSAGHPQPCWAVLSRVVAFGSKIGSTCAALGRAVACYAADMAPPLDREWPSRSAKTAIGIVVLMLGMLAGAGLAMWVMPPS